MNFVDELRWREMVHTMLTWVLTLQLTRCISATCVA